MSAVVAAKPADTHAIAIGIEKYGAGHSWNLNGPAVDAARFVRWLRSRGVPANNISLFANPLDENRADLDSLDVLVRSADSKTLVDALRDDFARRQGDLLLMLWGGHGVVGGDVRRLFYADVANNLLRNCDVDALLRYFRTLNGFPRQAFFFDACANYFELMQSPAGLADVPLPGGLPNTSLSQFVLYSANAGERATNFGAERTGAFSSCLLDELNRLPAAQWPPDLAGVKAGIEGTVAQMRAAGRASQTPVTYSYTDWDGNKGTFRNAAPGCQVTTTRASQLVDLQVSDRDQLVAALLDCAVMLSADRRDDIVADLRSDIANDIKRYKASRFDVIAIVKTAARFQGGLSELMHVVRAYEGDTLAARALIEVAQRLHINGG